MFVGFMEVVRKEGGYHRPRQNVDKLKDLIALHPGGTSFLVEGFMPIAFDAPHDGEGVLYLVNGLQMFTITLDDIAWSGNRLQVTTQFPTPEASAITTVIEGELDADGALQGTITIGSDSGRPMQMKIVGPTGRPGAVRRSHRRRRRRVTTARPSNAGRRCRLAALLLAAPLVVACGGPSMSQLKALVRASFPGVPQMSIEEFDRRLKDDPPPLVIDVREPFEYEVSHLPGGGSRTGRQDCRTGRRNGAGPAGRPLLLRRLPFVGRGRRPDPIERPGDRRPGLEPRRLDFRVGQLGTSRVSRAGGSGPGPPVRQTMEQAARAAPAALMEPHVKA